MSCAKEECKKLLRLSSGIIKHFVKESFSIDTKIAMRPCDKSDFNQNEKEPKEDEKDEKQDHSISDSCIAGQTMQQKNELEIDANDILKDPFVKTAGELFEPSRIIVKSKV